MEDILYTVKEVSILLKSNVEYVRKLIRAGLLPYLKLGNTKIRKIALDEFLAKHEGMDLTDPFKIASLRRQDRIDGFE